MRFGQNATTGLYLTLTCDMVDLWRVAGGNQEITLLATDDDDANTWRLETKCGLSIRYLKSCGNTNIVTGSTFAGDSDVWRLVSSGNFVEWNIK